MINQTQRQEQQQPTIVLPLSGGSRSGGQEVRIQEVLQVLFKRRTWLVVFALIGLVFGLSLSVLNYIKAQTIKQYAIRTSIALASQDENGMFSKSSRDPDSTDFHLAEDMVDAAQFILMSDSMLNKIIEDINLIGVSGRDIYSSLSMEQYKKTQIILINLYWENPSEGVEILESMNRQAPKLLLKTLKLGSVTVINDPTAHFVIGGNLNLTRNLILGIILGVCVGAAVAVLDLLLHPTLMTIVDVEKRLKIPLLGTISENYEETPIQLELLNLQKGDNSLKRSEIADCFLAAAYALKRHLRDIEHPCVLVTSADRGEGKTITTACLAAAFSRIGVRVLAVDLDFPNPMLAGHFVQHVETINSINALYQGKTVSRDAVLPVTGTLDLLPALLERDPMPLNLGTLDLIRMVREEYDIILLDTPPVGQIADTMVLNELTDLALFVIQYDGATQSTLQDAITRLNSVDIRVIGSIVNRVNHSVSDYRDRQSLAKKRKPLLLMLRGIRQKLRRPKDKKAKAPKEKTPKAPKEKKSRLPKFKFPKSGSKG